jgi:hypothetical protein
MLKILASKLTQIDPSNILQFLCNSQNSSKIFYTFYLQLIFWKKFAFILLPFLLQIIFIIFIKQTLFRLLK